ncbi:ABC transporter substrate-binding protein [Nonomuraea sp. NPDC050404]|uniref:ABC transporter substrate-binding protein n=1 Tax=Nonomuraea sp. NPDC050404 TaxID=3155783 RepID=UPI0033EE9F84
MRRLPRVITISVLVATFSLPAGCGSGTEEPSPARPAADRVTYVTGFGTFGREAYVYVAQEKGYFREAGIEVTVQPGQGSGENLAAVLGGRAQFSAIDFTATLISAANGKADGAVAVAALHQRTLAALMTLEGSGIGEPADLEGKTVADAASSVISMMFPAYAKLTGVDREKVKWVSLEPAQLAANLASGQVDAIGQYVVGEPTVRNAAKGRKVTVLPFGEVITDLYGSAVTTSATLAKDRPDLVRKFTGALLKGLAYAVDHPQEAAQILLKRQPAMNAESAAAELTLMAPYVRPSGGEPIGAMSRERVERAITALRTAGAFETAPTPESVVAFDLLPAG